MKKIVSLILAVIILVTPFVGCANNTGDEGKNPASSVNGSGSGDGSGDSPYLDLGLPVVDFKGREFRYYSRGPLADSELDPSAVDICSEGLNTEVLNNAVYERNAILEDLYKVKFVNYQFDEPYKNARIMISSDLYEAEIVTDAIGDLAGLAVESQLYDYNSFIQHTDFTKSWWDQNCYEQTSVMGRIFFMCGDITIMDNKATWAIAFNKDLIAENNLKSPYDSVNDKTWTYDQMYYLMQETTTDVDGNEIMDESDIWGLITQSFNQYALFVGGGARICDKDVEGKPYFSFDVEFDGAALTQASRINNAKEYAYSKFAGGIEQKRLFYNGGALFLICSMSIIQWMRPYEADFGVLPLPKMNEEQNRYYSSITPYHYCVYSIPASVPEDSLEFVDIMLENLAAYSQKLVEPAFYEKVLVGQGLRDQESEPMLDIIFSNVVYDLGAIYSFGGFSGLVESITYKRLPTFLAKTPTYQSVVDRDIRQFVELLEKRF